LAELGDAVKGPYFGVVAVRLDLSRGGFSEREMTLQDRKLLKYAALNIFDESLSEWEGLTFNGFGSELIGIVQLSASDGAEQRRRLTSQLHLIGQYVSKNLTQYLNIDATIGMSSLRDDAALLAKLMEEASLAVDWKRIHPDRRVFYYEDIAGQDGLGMVEWMAR